MRKIRVLAVITIGLIALSVGLSPAAIADTVRSGGSCQDGDRDRIQEGYSFRCIKAPRSITNMNGKKLVWKQLPGRKLEWTTSVSSTVSVLNTLHLGYWKQLVSPEYSDFDGRVFVSSLPCKIYMANSSEAELFIWNRQVNGNGYGGTWGHTDTQFWVVNEPNYGPAPCVKYFTLNYGGQRITQ